MYNSAPLTSYWRVRFYTDLSTTKHSALFSENSSRPAVLPSWGLNAFILAKICAVDLLPFVQLRGLLVSVSILWRGRVGMDLRVTFCK